MMRLTAAALPALVMTLALASGQGCSADGGDSPPVISGSGGAAGTDPTGGAPATGGQVGSGGGSGSGTAGEASGGAAGAPGGGGAATGGAGGTPGGSGGATGGTAAVQGLGPWTGADNVPPSSAPPFGLNPSQVPMFVSVGFDDNAYSGLPGTLGEGGMDWATAMLAARTNPAGSGNPSTYDGAPVSMSFFLATVYAGTWMSESPTFVKRAWNAAYQAGYEVGSHTHNHSHGAAFSTEQWDTEIQTSLDWLTMAFDPAEPDMTPNDTAGVGVNAADVVGFRTPYLEYNDALFSSLSALGFWYDCSVEEGWQPEQDGTNYFWPFTLDSGSPGHDVLVSWDLKDPMTGHAGLWEMPVHPVIVPPDDRCADYGVPSGLRQRMYDFKSFFDLEGGKITGFDYNLWVTFGMTKAEFLATLKYTFDLRMQGNRAPFMLGAHTDYYNTKYTAAPNATTEERQQAIEEFLDYVLTHPQARVVSLSQILEWVRNPEPLG